MNTLIGNCIGARDVSLALQVKKVSDWLTIVNLVFVCAFLVVERESIITLYIKGSNDLEEKKQALLVAALTIIFSMNLNSYLDGLMMAIGE